MKAWRICRLALALLLIGLALALSVLTLRGMQQGFEYAQAMQAFGLAAIGLTAVLALSIAAFRLRARCEKEPAPKACRAQPYHDKEMPDRRKNILRAALITLAALLILLGITNGGLWDVLVKAINICTECIGLG